MTSSSFTQSESLLSNGEGSLSGNLLPIPDADFPSVIREVVTNAPANRKVASFIATLSPLCALATRVRLNYYYDSRPSALLLQVIIEGAQSVGKSFAADIERLIMDSTLRLRDRQQRIIEQEYREQRRRNAKGKLDEEPKTTIRIIPATISKTVLTRRADYYERILGDTLTFWMFAEELAQVTDAGKQGYSNLLTIMRTAYDLGSLFGIDYASDNSYSAIVDINICSMFCATPSSIDDYIDRKAIEGGNCSRQILCRIDDEIGSDGARFVPYTDAQREAINRTLQRLMDDTYDGAGKLRPEIPLDTSWLDSTVCTWCRDRGTEALLTGREAIDVFRKRSSVSAFRCASLCFYLYLLDAGIDCHGDIPFDNPAVERAVSNCRKIYLFMADYILRSLLGRWGYRFEQLNARRDESRGSLQEPSLFAQLADEFSRDDLNSLLQRSAKRTPARVFICQWTKRNLIAPVGNDRYRKVPHTDPYKPSND